MSEGESHSVKRHLDVDATGYDVQIRRFIPHYDDMITTGVEPLAGSRRPRGTSWTSAGGTERSSAVLEGLPRVRVTVLDVDTDMLGEARRRLERFADRVAFREGKLSIRCPPRTL